MSYIRGDIPIDAPFYIVAKLISNSTQASVSAYPIWYGMAYETTTDRIVLTSNFVSFDANALRVKYKMKGNAYGLYGLDPDESTYFPITQTDNIIKLSSNSIINKTTFKITPKRAVVPITKLYGGLAYKIELALQTTTKFYAYKVNSTEANPAGVSGGSGRLGGFYTSASPSVLYQLTNNDLEFYFIPYFSYSYLANDTTLTDELLHFAKYILDAWGSYTKPIDNTTVSTSSGAVFTHSYVAHQRVFFSYCTGNELCGNCLGRCGNADDFCHIDQYSREALANGEAPLTCDLDRHTDVAHKHVYTLPIILLIGITLVGAFSIFAIYRNSKTQPTNNISAPPRKQIQDVQVASNPENPRRAMPIKRLQPSLRRGGLERK